MYSSSLFSFLILFSFSLSSSAQPPEFRLQYCNNDIGNYTNTSAFATNLDALLSSMASEKEATGVFFNLTAGDDSGVDRVNVMALCRGDVTSSDCNSCISDASRKIRDICPDQKEAVGWYSYCMLRYSNRSIFGSMVTQPQRALVSLANASEPEKHDQQLGTLLRSLQSEAAAGDSRRKFADGSARVGDFGSVFAVVDCTPDLSDLDCANCLEGLIGYIPNCCGGKKGAFIVTPSCDVGFDNYQLYNYDIQPLSPPPSSSTNGTITGKASKGGRLIIRVVVPTVVCIVLAALIFSWYFFTRRSWEKIERSSSVHDPQDDIKSIESLQFDFSIIRAATNNFSDVNKLGRGGFGPVYKGILSDGQQVAVKRLAKNSGQGELEFKNEVLLVAKLQHRNLVRLLGFCLEREERLLVYEFVPNASLDHFLFDPEKQKILDWHTRYKIIAGVARGMLYLHEDSRLRIIHRDLKASNILLDAEMNPKISDFGMAKLFQVDQTQGDTNRVVGTYGYMAPEYALHGFFSAKSDVYSFGVLVIEMISGRKCIGLYQGENSEDLISCLWRNWREGTAMSIVDRTISDNWRTEIMRCIHIGLLCVQEDAVDRPTMSAVVVMLSSHSFTLPVPSHPAYVTRGLTSQLLPLAPPLNPGFVAATNADQRQDYSLDQSKTSKTTTSSTVNEDTVSELLR